MAMTENATCNPKRRASLFHMWDSKEKSKKSWQQRNTNLDAKIRHCFTSFHHIPPLQGPPAELSPCLTSLVALAASKLYISCWKWMEMDGNGISDCVDHGLPFIHLRPTLWSPVNARYLRDNFINLLSATKQIEWLQQAFRMYSTTRKLQSSNRRTVLNTRAVIKKTESPGNK